MTKLQQQEGLVSLARSVYNLIEANQVMSRSELNSAFRASSNQKAIDNLTLVIRSLLQYGHVQRSRVVNDSTVYFWVTGTKTDCEVNTDPQVGDLPNVDYFKGEVLLDKPKPYLEEVQEEESQGSGDQDVLRTRKPSALPSWPPAKVSGDEVVEDSKDQSLPAYEAMSDYDRKVQLKAVSVENKTIDKIAQEIADRLDFFTVDHVYEITAQEHSKAVIGMRLAICASKGLLSRWRAPSTRSPRYIEIFTAITKKPPEGFVAVAPKKYQTKTNPPAPAVYTPPPTQANAPELPAVPKHCRKIWYVTLTRRPVFALSVPVEFTSLYLQKNSSLSWGLFVASTSRPSLRG